MPSSVAASSSSDESPARPKSTSRSPPFRYRRRGSSRNNAMRSPSTSPSTVRRQGRRRSTSRSSTSRSPQRNVRSSRRNNSPPRRFRSPVRKRSRSSSIRSREHNNQHSPRRYHGRQRNSRSRSVSPKRRNTRRRSISRSRSRSPEAIRNSFMSKRRSRRMLVLERGAPEVWGRSPVQAEIEEVYAAYLECEEKKQNEILKVEKLKETRNIERKLEEKKRRADVMKGNIPQSPGSDTSVKKKKKKKEKKEKKGKKAKKEKKKKSKNKKSKNDDDDSDEWVEVTHDMRMEEAAREAKEEQEIPGPALPEHLQSRSQIGIHIKANYGKDMLKGEAAAMAAYAARGERIPRRGEIGLSSAEISEFEKVGYVMSGTRHKAMEATRLRKENQVLTAEEKRLLSGFSQEERKKKEMAMLGQMRSLIASKRVE